MKVIDLPCMGCAKMEKHLISGSDGVYDAICRICKRRVSVAVSDDLLEKINEEDDL